MYYLIGAYRRYMYKYTWYSYSYWYMRCCIMAFRSLLACKKVHLEGLRLWAVGRKQPIISRRIIWRLVCEGPEESVS